MVDYSGRKIGSVQVWGFRKVTFNADEAPGVQSYVEITLKDERDLPGSLQITMTVATRTSADPTLSECQRAALEAALALLKRAGEETVDSLEAAQRP